MCGDLWPMICIAVVVSTPARLKFLKSDAGESAQISRVVTQMALCYPEVGFTLTSAGRKALSVPPVRQLADRLYQLYGDRPDLVFLDVQTANVYVTFDGSTPAAGNGHLLVSGEKYFWPRSKAQAAKFIRATGTSGLVYCTPHEV